MDSGLLRDFGEALFGGVWKSMVSLFVEKAKKFPYNFFQKTIEAFV